MKPKTRQKLDRFLAKVKAIGKRIDFQDLLLLAGGALVFRGTYMIYPPLAYVIIGCGLIYMGHPGGNQGGE